MQKKGQVISAEELFHAVWGDEYFSKSNNTITVHIRHLREKCRIPLKSPIISKPSGGVDTKLKAKVNLKYVLSALFLFCYAALLGLSIYLFIAKEILFPLLLLLLLFYLLSVVLAAHFYAQRKSRKIISTVSSMIHTYMHHDLESDDVFPPAYAEIAAQAVQIKSTMQRHEQAIKNETDRKNDLITYLAHDLKTPLTSVIGYLDLLEEASDMPELQRRKYIHITLDKALRLEKLINEFFEITRYNLQQIVLERNLWIFPSC